METEETAAHTHVIVYWCVAHYRAENLETSKTIPEAYNKLRALLGILEELEWQELRCPPKSRLTQRAGPQVSA